MLMGQLLVWDSHVSHEEIELRPVRKQMRPRCTLDTRTKRFCPQHPIYYRNRTGIRPGLVMGSIDKNRHRYSIDTLAKVSIVSILRYPPENPHHELHIHKLVTYFDIFQLLDFEFFQNF